jgi:hypothetical protein
VEGAIVLIGSINAGIRQTIGFNPDFREDLIEGLKNGGDFLILGSTPKIILRHLA